MQPSGSVILLGDSHLTDFSWLGVPQLGPRLRAQYASVHSEAEGGLTSRMALAKYEERQLDENWCIISLGCNDVVPANGITEKEFESNYRQLITQLGGPQLILMGPGPVNEASSEVQGRTNERLSEFADIVSDIAKQTGAHYLSLFALLDVHTHLVDDGIHINQQGYDVLAMAILNLMFEKN